MKDEAGFDFVIIYKDKNKASEDLSVRGLPFKPLLMLESNQFERLAEDYKIIREMDEEDEFI